MKISGMMVGDVLTISETWYDYIVLPCEFDFLRLGQVRNKREGSCCPSFFCHFAAVLQQDHAISTTSHSSLCCQGCLDWPLWGPFGRWPVRQWLAT